MADVMMESQEEKLQLFVSLTGTENTELAIQILEQNNWDIDTSVNFYYNTNDIVDKPSTSSKTGGSGGSGSKSPIKDFVEDEEDFREPIPQTMDRLVDTSLYDHYRSRRPVTKPTNVFESFRDFEKEKGINQNLTGKQKTLAELFKPPLDILTFGSFEEIKHKAQEKHRFALINVQDVSEFACQRLNRDTWSDAKLKELISENFVFWQVNSTHEEGKWFIQYYPTQEFPYISIVDPRTGEELANTTGFIDADDMKEYLNTFISSNSYDKSSKLHPSQLNKNFKKKKFITEEEELEMAIQASLAGSNSNPQSPIKSDSPNNEPITTTSTSTTTTTSKKLKTEPEEQEEQEEDNYIDDDLDKYDNKEEREKIEKKAEEQPPSTIGNEGDCVIQIKLPDQTIKGNFNSTDLIKNLYYFVQIKTGKFNFKLFTTFPKTELVGNLMNKTLKEMDLTPRAQLFFSES